MLWLALLTLPDGSQVESNILSGEAAETGSADRAYRLRRTDGSVTDFSSLPSVLQHLAEVYDLDDLSPATGAHETLSEDLGAGDPHRV